MIGVKVAYLITLDGLKWWVFVGGLNLADHTGRTAGESGKNIFGGRLGTGSSSVMTFAGCAATDVYARYSHGGIKL